MNDNITNTIEETLTKKHLVSLKKVCIFQDKKDAVLADICMMSFYLLSVNPMKYHDNKINTE